MNSWIQNQIQNWLKGTRNPRQMFLDLYNLRLVIEEQGSRRFVSDDEFCKIIEFFEKHKDYAEHPPMVESEFIQKFFADEPERYFELKDAALSQKGINTLTLMKIRDPDNPTESALTYWNSVIWRETTEFQRFLSCVLFVRATVPYRFKTFSLRWYDFLWLSEIRKIVYEQSRPYFMPIERRGDGKTVAEIVPEADIDLQKYRLEEWPQLLGDAPSNFHLVLFYEDFCQGALEFLNDPSWVKQCIVCSSLFAIPAGKPGRPRVYCSGNDDGCSVEHDRVSCRFESQARRRFRSSVYPPPVKITEKRRLWKREQTHQFFMKRLHEQGIDCFESALPCNE